MLVEAFPDCDPDAWYAEAVAWAASQGLMTGYDDGEISAWANESVAWAVSCGLLRGYDETGELGPIDPLERAQLAAVLMRLAQAAA